MSTKMIHKVLERFFERASGNEPELWELANQEVEAIETAAGAIVAWNEEGRPAFHLDAARGYDVLERIAKESK